MAISKFNQEGYPDPTSFEALTNVADAAKATAYRPLVYVCSPYAGDTERNSDAARKYSRFAFDKGNIPITPHLLYPQILDDENPKERNYARHINYVLLGFCQELWVFGTKVTSGMAHEIGIAKKRRMKIRYFNELMQEAL